MVARPVKRLDFDGSIADAIADVIDRYKSSLRVISSLRFDGRCNRSLEERMGG
jgi:hypothetical protein